MAFLGVDHKMGHGVAKKTFRVEASGNRCLYPEEYLIKGPRLEFCIKPDYRAESRNRIERFIAWVPTAAANSILIKQVVGRNIQLKSANRFSIPGIQYPKGIIFIGVGIVKIAFARVHGAY